jgi:hypothetical protein
MQETGRLSPGRSSRRSHPQKGRHAAEQEADEILVPAAFL